MIYSGRPVFITGQRNKILGVIPTDGHAWVLDGYILRRKGTKSQHLFHCNWGWDSDCNGYYQSKMFHASKKLVIAYPQYGDEKTSGYDRNYKYNLEIIRYADPIK